MNPSKPIMHYDKLQEFLDENFPIDFKKINPKKITNTIKKRLDKIEELKSIYNIDFSFKVWTNTITLC